MEIKEVIRSKYCWIVGILSALAGYFLVIKPFLTPYSPLSVVVLSYIFLVLFAVSVACLIRNIKNRAKTTNSLTSLLGYVLGFASIQTCFASGVCITNLTVPLITTFFPAFAKPLFEEFSMFFLILSIGLIGYSLYSMKCFEEEKKVKFVTKL